MLIKCAVSGMVAGLAGAIAWRYTLPRRLLDLAQTELPPGTQPSTITRVTSIDYVSGPAWLPLIVVLPAIGLVTGIVIGLLAERVGRRVGSAPTVFGETLGGACVGAVTGIVGGIVFSGRTPDIYLRSTDSPVRSGRRSLDLDNLPGAPGYHHLGFTELQPQLMLYGTVFAAVTALVLVVVRRNMT